MKNEPGTVNRVRSMQLSVSNSRTISDSPNFVHFPLLIVVKASQQKSEVKQIFVNNKLCEFTITTIISRENETKHVFMAFFTKPRLQMR